MPRHRHDFVLLHPSKPELLGVAQGEAFTLPGIVGEAWMLTSNLQKALRSELSLEAVMLRPAYGWNSETEDTTTLYVLVSRTDTLPTGARWLDLRTLQAGSLTYSRVNFLETILREDVELTLVPPLRPAWAKRGWLEEVKNWLARELARLGRVPVGEPEQVKHWSLSAVLR